MSIGSFLRRATTIPKRGILSPLRHVFGETPLDEIGAVGGFLVGGPAGAAAGSGLGSLAHGAPLSSAVGNAAKYGALGVGANAALGAVGGGTAGALGNLGHDLAPIGNAAKGFLGNGAGVAGATGQSGGGGILSHILDFAKKNPALLLGGAGLLNSAHQQSGADDSRNQAIGLLQTDMQRRQPLFDALLKRMSEGPPPAQAFGYRDPGNPYAASYR